MPAKHIEWLRVANAGDFSDKKPWFYPFKTRFCRAHALPDGYDLQVITLKCWCGDGIWRGSEYTLPERFWERCHKCGGTGIYLKKNILLIRLLLRDLVFHEPSQLVTYREGFEYKNRFEGLIKHPPSDPKAARRAMERLMLRYEPETLKRLYLSRARDWAYWKRVGIQSAFRRLNQRLRALAGQELDEVPF